MKALLAILILTATVALQVEAQDVRSKVGLPSETSLTNIIDPDKSLYGAQWGSSEDEFINKFGSPTGYIRLNGTDTVMLYGKSHAFIFTAAKLSGVRITGSVFDGKLSQAQLTQTPFDAIRWQLSNGVRKDMNLADVKKILGDSLKSIYSQSYYFNSNKTRIELDFAHFPREGEKDEAYRIYGLYLRQGTSVALQPAPVSARPRDTLIPEATRPCTAEVATWWQAVRAAAKEMIDARRRENQAITAWYQAHSLRFRIESGQGNGLPKKERDKLDADIAAAVEKYRQVLAEGQAKSYRPPIEDSARPLILYLGAPMYTEEARRNKIMGQVNMRAEFRSDGTIGEVEVVSGLKDGLDEQAIKTTRETIFLPGVKDGMFVTIWRTLYVEFNLR
jgi:TonB family protein